MNAPISFLPIFMSLNQFIICSPFASYSPHHFRFCSCGKALAARLFSSHGYETRLVNRRLTSAGFQGGTKNK